MRKLYFLIAYDNNVPFMSIPTYSKTFNNKNLIKKYNLNLNVKFKLETKDKFIGG